jgi:hypothetical protein
MKTIQTQVYSLSELSAAAKEKAREWYRNGDTSFDADSAIEDAKQAFATCGITIDRVLYSGFCSQGDGACFEGTWRAADVKPGAMREYAPKDAELHRIAAEFERLAALFPLATFTVRHSGRYLHEGCTDFSFSFPDQNGDETDAPGATQAERDLEEAAKDAMRWIYRQLEGAYEWDNADEQVDEAIEANEYTFTEDGRRFG